MAIAHIKVDCNVQTVFEGKTINLYVVIGGRKMRFQKVKVTQADDALFLSDGEKIVVLNWKYIETMIAEENNIDDILDTLEHSSCGLVDE